MHECVDKALEIVHGLNNRDYGNISVEAHCDYGLICCHNKYTNHEEINSVVCAEKTPVISERRLFKMKILVMCHLLLEDV